MGPKREAHVNKQSSFVNFLLLPYEIRHSIYLFIYRPANVQITLSYRRFSCQVDGRGKEAHLRATNCDILNLLLTCKQINAEYSKIAYSQNTFLFDFDESSDILQLRKLGVTNLEALRRLKLNFDPFDARRFHFPPKEPIFPKETTISDQQDALVAPLMAGLKEMDIHMFNPCGPRTVNNQIYDRYERWLKTIEPMLRIMGRHIDRKTEVRLHYDNRHGPWTQLIELFNQCLGKGRLVICHSHTDVRRRIEFVDLPEFTGMDEWTSSPKHILTASASNHGPQHTGSIPT